MSSSLPIINGESSDAPPPAPAASARADRLHDSHGRVIRDLRLSITDRCNYRCVYCLDPDHRFMRKMELLQLEELVTVTRVAASLGIEKLRITGGEPLLYPQFDELLDRLGGLGLNDIALTTNGSLFDRAPLDRWRKAGLKRVTLSLDSLKPERVAKVTRVKAGPQSVIDAIRLARAAGFDPIKVNAVVMRGVNDDELADFADFAREHAIDMRLIEFMPLDDGHRWSRGDVVGADEMIEKIGARHALTPVGLDHEHGTALNFTFADGAPGRIGIIAPVTHPFCGACSRMRITADGKVRPCLFSHTEWDLRPLLRGGADDQAIARFMIDSMWTKQEGHGIGSKSFHQPDRTMSAIGG